MSRWDEGRSYTRAFFRHPWRYLGAMYWVQETGRFREFWAAYDGRWKVER